MKLAILGAGQLGGSFAAALKQADRSIFITAYDTIAEHAHQLHQAGNIDEATTSPSEAVSTADIILFASPLRSYRSLAQAIAPVIKPHSIVTDVGSVKAPMQAIAPILSSARIVPAHPIAGTEKSGPSATNADLFRGKLCILTPHQATEASAITTVETLWHLAGSDVIHMPTQVHDQVYAHVSHLPHFIAFITAHFYAKSRVTLNPTDAVLQKFLRIAHSDPRMWADIAIENREALLAAFATYGAVIEHMIAELQSGDAGADNPHAITALLPRVIASTLISAVSLYERQCGMNLKAFAGAGLRDMIAPAMHTPEQDIEAISHAAGSVAKLLHAWLQSFHRFTTLIGAEDGEAIFETLCAMRQRADSLTTHVRQ